MNPAFEADAYPGRPKILFVGLGDSSHTHSWIDLLQGAPFNVRLFALRTGLPPADWPVRTYITAYGANVPNSETRARLFSANRGGRFAHRKVARVFGAAGPDEIAAKWLMKIVQRWRPDVVHTLGLFPAGEFYFRALKRFEIEPTAKWVSQTRGGSDLALNHLNPDLQDELGTLLRACDQLLSDNQQNFDIAREMGVREEQLSAIGTVPGTGGIDVDHLTNAWVDGPSRRRTIVWPKAYESPWGKVLPIFEALKLSWERIQPCEVHILAADAETRMWYWSLPEHIRRSCHLSERVARERVLTIMSRARVMLAPSLVDGVPNSMYEAMAAGAFPIVSPLETIRPVVEDGKNVLFARNLYPEEIAEALARAMTDDTLVESAAERNIALVRQIANRAEIRTRVCNFYERLATHG